MEYFTFSWGRNYIAIRGVLHLLGHTLAEPGPLTDDVIQQGVTESSPFLCYSGKAVIGQLLNQLEMGQRNLIFLSSQGLEACRCSDTGAYFKHLTNGRFPGFTATRLGGNTAEESLRLMQKSFPGITRRQHDRVFRLYYYKLGVLDTIAKEALKCRSLAADGEKVTQLENTYCRLVDRRNSPVTLWLTGFDFCRRLYRLKRRKNKPRLRIGLVGGEHILSELDHVMGKIKSLADKGIYLEWRSGFFAINLMANREKPARGRDGLPYLKKRTAPYLRREASGTEVLSAARAIEFAEEGFDGLLHIQAFGCLPQMAVKPVLKKISRDYSVPLLSLSLGDRFDTASMETRLEAFLDILLQKKQQGENNER